MRLDACPTRRSSAERARTEADPDSHSLVLTERVRDHDEVTSRQSPPADFPLYGLTDAAWAGPRWLRFYEGVLGEIPIGMHLAHGGSEDLFQDRGPWAEVRSLPRRRFDHGVADGQNDSVREVALYTWMSRGFGSAEVHDDLAKIEADAHQDWLTHRWTLDGEAVDALVVPDHPDALGAWAAFTATPEVYVVVVARMIRPADIRLARVLDGSTYGMTFGAMLDFPGSIERSIRKAFGSVSD